MTNHTLEKPNDWWQLHLPLVTPLKFGQDFCHISKGSPTFLYRERKHWKLCANHSHQSIEKGASNGPQARRSVTTAGSWTKAHDGSFLLRSRPSVDRQVSMCVFHACVCIFKTCVHILHVCACILMPKNSNFRIFVVLFCFYHMFRVYLT